MDELKKEIREALLGSLIPSDNVLRVSVNRWVKYRAGMQDGSEKVLFFGVMSRKRWYLSRKNAKQIRELAVKGMQNMGRMIALSSAPDLEAVYCTYLLNNPAILTFQRNQDGSIELTAYSGRGFSGWLACFRTLNRFQKEVPEVLQRMSEEDEQIKQNVIREQVLEIKLQKKQAKQDKKQEKKRLRREKRKEQLEKMVGFLPSNLLSTRGTGNGTMIPGKEEQEKQPDEVAAGPDYEEETAGNSYEETQAETVTTNSLDAMQEEQARLLAEAEAAKLEARAAQARLEAAQAKLAAQEAQAKLAEVEAKLQAQSMAVTKRSADEDKKGIDHNGSTAGNGNGNHNGNQNNHTSGNGSNKNRRKKR